MVGAQKKGEQHENPNNTADIMVMIIITKKKKKTGSLEMTRRGLPDRLFSCLFSVVQSIFTYFLGRCIFIFFLLI